MATPAEQSAPPPLLRTVSGSKPKGILKNAPAAGAAPAQPAHLTWDEANLALTEIQKDSLMKITEPKTPYVRYNALTDEVENMADIPAFDLGPRSGTPSNPTSPTEGSMSSGRPPSGSSSRSTSFSLPGPGPGTIRVGGGALGEEQGEVEEDEELSPEAAAKHADFVRARGRHYSNEAEAMKRAQRLLAEDDDEEDDSERHPPPPEEEHDYEHEEDANASMEEAEAQTAAPTINGRPGGHR